MEQSSNPHNSLSMSVEALALLITGQLPDSQAQDLIQALNQSELYQSTLDGLKIFLKNEGPEALNELIENGVKSRNIEFFAQLMCSPDPEINELLANSQRVQRKD